MKESKLDKVIKTLNNALTAKENYPWARAEMSFEFIEMLIELLNEQKQQIWELQEVNEHLNDVLKRT